MFASSSGNGVKANINPDVGDPPVPRKKHAVYFDLESCREIVVYVYLATAMHRIAVINDYELSFG